METQNKTAGKTATESIGVTEMQKRNSRKDDGYGNVISVKNLDELKDFVDISLNREMWLNEDRIQISNKEGCVINTIVIKDRRLK